MVGFCMAQVEKLHQELDGEIELKRVLQCALQGPVHSCPCSSLMLPTKVAYQESLCLRPIQCSPKKYNIKPLIFPNAITLPVYTHTYL